MKEIKVKPVIPTVNNGITTFSQKNSQATEEQIRYAKLSQMNSNEDSKIQEKMKEVSEITRKPPDIVSIALHDCSYDTNLAIQNILEGHYDENFECEWKTKSTKSRKKPSPSVEDSPNHTDSGETNIDKLCNDFGAPEIVDQKTGIKINRSTRGGGSGSSRGHLNPDNCRNDKSPSDERCCDHQPEKPFGKERGRLSDRNRGRGRGRGMRGGLNRGARGGRGGFGRGGSFRGSSRQGRGFNRGSSGRDRGNRKQENDVIHISSEDDWGVDNPVKINDKAQDWGDEIVNVSVETDWAKDDADWTKENTNWSKDDWGDQPDPGERIFSRDLDWSQLNGQESDRWNQSNSTSPKENRLKYLPENIDAAVIRSIPNSSSTGEVTSYQPTDDISRYINSPSNQFPSSHQEGGLTNSLNDRAFSLTTSVAVSDVIHRTISSMPIVSGVTESHKLEQEQLRTSKTQQSNKPRRTHNRYATLPTQPVVMPRSAQMVNDIEEQFTGLEFGSGPLSPSTSASTSEKQLPVADLSNTKNHQNENSIGDNVSRQPVAGLSDEVLISHSQKVLPPSSIITVTSSKIETTIPQNQIITKADVLKTPPGFKPLDQNTHFLASAVRGHNRLTPEPIPFPSSTNRTSPTPAINVFSRNGGLGTSVVISDHQPSISNYSDQKVYDHHESNINAEKIIADQKALAEKQFLAEQQLALSEKNERTRSVVDQRSFAEEKPQVQSKLLSGQLQSNDQQSTPEDLTRSDHCLKGELPDQRKSLPDPRHPLNENHRQTSSKDGIKLGKTDVEKVSSKLHNQSTSQLTSGMSKTTYSSGASISNEIMSLTVTSSTQTTTKTQGTANKTTSAPPGVLAPMNLYAGVQPGMIQAYQKGEEALIGENFIKQQALHGYGYDELLQMQRVPMGPPYTYDVSMYPTGATGPSSAREGIQTYQGNDSKFNRGADESSPVNIPQGSPHVAAGNIPTQQQAAYMNATGQLPYGYTYAYQPNVLPQGGVFPAFTTPSVYQMPQGKGNQFQNQYQASAQQQQAGYNSSKFSGTSAHEYSKGNFHNSGSAQVALSAHPKGTQQSTTSTSSTTIQSGPRLAYKSQYNQDGKGYLANSPTSMTTQHGLHMHNQAAAAAAHIGNVNHYLVQPHTNMMTHSGQISASHISQQQIDASTHRSQVHQIPFSGNQQKRDTKGSYRSYWLGNR